MKLVCGVGINDADYVVQPLVGGKQVCCPYYRTWKNMLKRCYHKSYQEGHKSYTDCTVCEEWLTFSKFKSWMEKQDWKGKELDKDILFIGNKSYSPETSVFVTDKVNLFLLDSGATRGEYLIGVYFEKKVGKFRAQCATGKVQRHLGYYSNELEAHLAWKSYKHKLACKLADEQTDSRVAEALRKRYL